MTKEDSNLFSKLEDGTPLSHLRVVPTIGGVIQNGRVKGFCVVVKWPTTGGDTDRWLGISHADNMPRAWLTKDHSDVEVFQSWDEAAVAAGGAEALFQERKEVRIERIFAKQLEPGRGLA